MLDRKRIQSIQIARRDAGLDEAGYRALLRRVAGAESSRATQLGDAEYQDIMRELRGLAHPGERQPEPGAGGWTARQLQTWGRYQRLCLGVLEARQLLRAATGANHEQDPSLDQGDFDQAMAEIEAELEYRVETGRAEAARGMDLRYWRNRRPAPGAVNSRELKMIGDLWAELEPYLGEGARNERYLLALVAKAARAEELAGLASLTGRQARLAIEALKSRLAQVKRKAEEPELESVPF